MNDNYTPIFDRSSLLIGEENCQKLANARVLVLGIGGVGGYALENLARAGIGHLTIVDGDNVDITNCNRQLSALINTVGKTKTDVWCERIKNINPDAEVVPKAQFLRTPEDIENILAPGFDFAIDAIDELEPKITFIRALKRKKIPFISAMGAGGKLDPTQIKIADISKTNGCPLARVVRKKLREFHIEKGVKTVYSPEPPLKRFADRKIGSISFIPAIFGCFCAAEAVNSLIKKS